MKWDVIGLGDVRRKEESFTTLQSGHLPRTNRCSLPHKHEMERQHNKSILLEFQSSRISPMYNREITTEDRSSRLYAPTTSHSDEETDNFYNTIDKVLETLTHYTIIVMRDFNAKVGRTNKIQQKVRQDASGWAIEMKGETLVEWATSNKFKIINQQFQKKAGRRWTWRSPDGNTKNEIDYTMTDKPSMVTDVTVINRLNIGGDHMMVMGSVTLNTKAERRSS